MKRVVVLTEVEFEELVNKQEEPNKFLEQELAEAKTELHRLREYKLLYDNQTEKLKVPTQGHQEHVKLTDKEVHSEYRRCILNGNKKTKSCEIIGNLVGKSSTTIRRIVLKQEKEKKS
jgi:hypothetical protein